MKTESLENASMYTMREFYQAKIDHHHNYNWRELSAYANLYMYKRIELTFTFAPSWRTLIYIWGHGLGCPYIYAAREKTLKYFLYYIQYQRIVNYSCTGKAPSCLRQNRARNDIIHIYFLFYYFPDNIWAKDCPTFNVLVPQYSRNHAPCQFLTEKLANMTKKSILKITSIVTCYNCFCFFFFSFFF